MRVVVHHDIGDLADDLTAAVVDFQRQGAQAVRRNVRRGNALARGFARESAGPHGKNYYKRLTAEMTGPLSGEYGPEGEPKSEFVGVGFRHGVNLDLPKSADLIGPTFAKDVGDIVDGLFW